MSRRRKLRRDLAVVAVVCWSVTQGDARPLLKSPPAPKEEACPEMGEGFVRVAGSGTCVQMSGSVRVEGMHRTGGTSLDPENR